MSALVTSCGVLVVSPNHELLLGHATGGRHWDIFKGLQELGEAPRDAAMRELFEECGLTPEADSLIDLGRFDYLPKKKLHLFATRMVQVETSTLRCSSSFVDRLGNVRPELDAFAWVPFEKIADRCGKSMTRVLTLALPLTAFSSGLDAAAEARADEPRSAPWPVRIQLSRAKGWRMPDNTVNVARPGQWGNPFPIDKAGPDGTLATDQETSVNLFVAMLADLEQRAAVGYPSDLKILRGKNLACWCKTGMPCHADILLSLVNADADS